MAFTSIARYTTKLIKLTTKSLLLQSSLRYIPSSPSNYQQNRSYLWISVPEDDDAFYGQNLDDNDALGMNDETLEATSDGIKNDGNKMKKDKKGQGGNNIKGKKKEINIIKFNLKDYQNMETDNEGAIQEYGSLLSSDITKHHSLIGDDLEECIAEENIELTPGDEYSQAYDSQEVDLAIDMHGSDEARNFRTEHLKEKERRRMIQNKIKGRLSSDPVSALVAFANYKREATMSRRDLKKAEPFIDQPGIPLDEEYSASMYSR